MPDFIGAATQELGGRLKSAIGLIQQGKANKILKGLQYPTETLPGEYQQNQNLATQMAATGLPSEQYNLAMKNIQRQQLAAMRASQDRRGGLGVLPGILQQTNDASLGLDAQNAAMRLRNQRNLISVNNQVAGVKRDLFNKNIRDKYLRNYQYAMQLKGTGNANLFGGLDQALGATAKFAGSQTNNNEGGY